MNRVGFNELGVNMRKLALSCIVATTTIAPAMAQPNTPLGAATAVCGQVAKADGRWTIRGHVTLNIGRCQNVRVGRRVVTPRSFVMCGADLYDVLEQICGKR
jgi:hypothetical protein